MQPYFNPWSAVFEQVWICQQLAATTLKGIEIELCMNPFALAKYCAEPSDQRLIPLEFHGERRRATRLSQSESEQRSQRVKSDMTSRSLT